jgi:hypothetical protein
MAHNSRNQNINITYHISHSTTNVTIMYRLLSVVKNTALLLAIVSNNRADAKASNGSSSASSASAAVSKPTGWVSTRDPSYIAASTPTKQKLVSVSRRSITFYDEDHKNLDYAHLVGASFVKAKPKTKKDTQHDLH